MEQELEALEDTLEVNQGVIQKFLEELPDKAFHLGLRLVLAGLAFLIGMQIIRLLRKVLKKALRRGKAEDGVIRFVDSVVKFALYAVLIMMIASGMGVDAASILAILGSAGVAIGLAIQGSLSNFAGGVLIMITKPFVTGDYIKDASGHEGTVEAVELIYTQLLTYDHKVIVLPNGNLANGAITNYTRSANRRIDIPVSIAYEEDIQTAREILLEVMKKEKGVMQGEEIRVIVDSLGESSVNLTLRCWALQKDYWEAVWSITEKAKYALDHAGISISYPQLDVHCNMTQK